MNDLNGWGLDQATDEQRRQEAERLVGAVLNRVRQPLIDAVVDFFKQPLSPLALMLFEVALLGQTNARNATQYVRAGSTGLTAEGSLV